MSQNGQTHFTNLAANDVSDHSGTLCIKGLRVAAFIIFPTSIIVLFEIPGRFKGHFLKELRVSH